MLVRSHTSPTLVWAQGDRFKRLLVLVLQEVGLSSHGTGTVHAYDQARGQCTVLDSQSNIFRHMLHFTSTMALLVLVTRA